MPKYKSTNDIMKVISNKDQIRNFSVIAHVDHGKTTMSDSLLSGCGIISPSVAGEALALDTMDMEQKRGITINSTNITLYHEHENVPFVFNMIDTPGHVDFNTRVSRSLRAIDGAVVVSDAVEGVMTQTETVTRQALEELVRPVLYINKIDRLVKELRLTPEKMQEHLMGVIREFNALIDLYAEPELKDKWKVSIQDNSIAFGSAKDRWAFSAATSKKSGVNFKTIFDAYNNDKVDELVENSPLHEAILGMVIQHHPAPHVAQKYRIPKIWKGDLDSEIGKALINCDEKGPAVMMIVNINIDPMAGSVATGRLFSGTLKDGDTVQLLGAKRSGRIQSVNMFMGNQRELVGQFTAGNIPALLGLEHARAGETLSSQKGFVEFESIAYVSEPVVTIAIESKHPKELPKLVEALRKLNIEDPSLVVKINEESGEMLIAGMGVLHLEVATNLLKEQNIEIITSPPLINYRETISGKAGPIMAKSPNRHNKLFFRVEPLSNTVIELIRSGKISDNTDKKELAEILRNEGWDRDEAKRVVSIEPGGNMFVDATKGVQYVQESMDSILAGFFDVVNNGPIAYENVRGFKATFHHYVPHEDVAHRSYAQLMPATRRALLGALLSATPTLLEPIQGIEVKAPADLIGEIAGVISSKRGKVGEITQKAHLSVIHGEIPASETFDLSEKMRGATAGKAIWSTHFKEWSQVPNSMLETVIADIRKRRGLSPSPPPASDFIDKD
tara:strand:- start:1335 stop:3527 length:2193 start_codon:yes stop_codon:yes gene_type:complete